MLRGLSYTPISLVSRINAGTYFTDVDGRDVRPQAENCGAQTLPVCADARAAIPLQSGVRRLRKDSISRAYPEEGVEPGRVLQGGGRVRHADGFHPRRRAAYAPANRQDRRRPGRAQEVHLSVHQRVASKGKAESLQAKQVFDVFRSHGRAARTP